MKYTLLCLLFLPVLARCQSGAFSIEGKAPTDLHKKIYLVYSTGTATKIDSATTTNGSFLFKGSVIEPLHATLIVDHAGIGLMQLNPQTADKMNIYLEKAAMHINLVDSISKSSITGSQMNADYRALQLQMKPVSVAFAKLMSDLQKMPADKRDLPETQELMMGKYQEIIATQKKILADYVRKNPKKFASLDALRDYGGPEANEPLVEELFNRLSPEIRKTGAAKEYAEVIKRSGGTRVGAMAPEFTQNDPQGNPVSLTSFRGKYVLLDFWASWCGPCRQENPNVVSVYNQYKDKNFTVLGVSLDRPDGKNAWLKAIENDHLSWTHVSDLNYFENAVAVRYGIQAIPRNFLLDPTGKIIARDLRGPELKRKIAEFIK